MVMERRVTLSGSGLVSIRKGRWVVLRATDNATEERPVHRKEQVTVGQPIFRWYRTLQSADASGQHAIS